VRRHASRVLRLASGLVAIWKKTCVVCWPSRGLQNPASRVSSCDEKKGGGRKYGGRLGLR
jgi:hypothetical protein